MKYTPMEKEVLSLFDRTDYKNISKNELIGYVSKLSELRPEVAKEVIAQFPELAKLIQSTATEYKGTLETIIAIRNCVLNILNQSTIIMIASKPKRKVKEADNFDAQKTAQYNKNTEKRIKSDYMIAVNRMMLLMYIF